MRQQRRGGDSTRDARSELSPVEVLFRKSYGKLLASLIARGFDSFVAEDAVSWAFSQMVQESDEELKSEAWLQTVAFRRAIDELRRTKKNEHYEEVHEPAMSPGEYEAVPDERMRLFFLCTHPAIDRGIQPALMLQMVMGLTAEEISKLYVTTPAQVSQRLVRAKRKIKDAGIHPNLPDPEEVAGRTQAIRDAIYGLYCSAWENAVSVDSYLTARETIELAATLVELTPDDPENRGLLALMLFCESRREARTSVDGSFVALDDQDIEAWDTGMISRAEEHLRVAMQFRSPGRYQLEAAIQSAHYARLRFGAATWDSILSLYEGLIRVFPTLSAKLGRIAVVAKLRGAEEALRELEGLRLLEPSLDGYQPYHALGSHLYEECGRLVEAVESARVAGSMSEVASVRDYFAGRVRTLKDM